MAKRLTASGLKQKTPEALCSHCSIRFARSKADSKLVPAKQAKADYLWAVMIARIYEVFPLVCSNCGGLMRIIAFITHSADVRRILDHIGVESQPPPIAPARGPPLWENCGDVQAGEVTQIEPDWDLAAQPAPDYEVDRRVNW